jgi:hypothetical protein
MTEDFTLLALGFSAMEGIVVRCSRCGRNGILEQPAGRPSSCVHVCESTVLSDGLLVEPTDCCALPEA